MTNLITVRSVEEFMADYTPGYAPIVGLFLNGAVQHSEDVGSVDFKRVELIGDIRNKTLTPKDTTMHMLNSKEGSKTFKKYFQGSKFIQSKLQSVRGFEDIQAQALDEHNKQFDEAFLTGDGQNNGLYTSSDANYQLNDSYEVDNSNGHLTDLYAKMTSVIEDANDIQGKKMVMLYGSTLMPKFNGLFTNTSRSFLSVIREAFPEVDFVKMPSEITPSGGNGFMVINMQKIKTHYITLPKVHSSGVNAEEMYGWTNFLSGSSMVDVLAKGAIIRQPLTLEA